MHISKITVGRLYNLGSYEHVRYELTVEVPAGESPSTALIGVENILNALNPKRPDNVKDQSELDYAANRLEEMKSMDQAKFDAQFSYAYPQKSRADIIAQHERHLAEHVQRRERWEGNQAKARKLLEDLGGAANYKDAKLDWDNGDND